MALSFGTVGTFAAADNASVTPTMPGSIVAGQVLLCFASARGNGTLGCAGWTQYFQEPHASSGLNKIALFWKVAAGGDASPTVTYSGGNAGETVIAEVVAVSGADTSTPFVEKGTVASNGSASNIGAITGITIAAGNAVMVFGHRADDWTSIATLTGDGLTWAEISDAGKSTLGSDAGQVWDYALCPAGATIGNKTFVVTGGSANPGMGVMVELAASTGTLAHIDTATRLRLAVRSFVDAATRFRLRVQSFVDTSTRFKLNIRGYIDTATRLRLRVTAYRDTATRFVLSGPHGYIDTAMRLVLSGQGYTDTQTRLRLRVMQFVNTAVRFKLRVAAFVDTNTRFNLQVRSFVDTFMRLRLQVDAYRDTATRFVLIVATGNYEDTATRLHLAVLDFVDTATRLRLQVTDYVDTVIRFRLFIAEFVFTNTRFVLSGQGYTDTAMRFRLQYNPATIMNRDTHIDITAKKLGA